MATGFKYSRRRQVILDESGYSDGGLYSDDEYKPPVSYLQRRRNAICVTSISADRDTSTGTAHVLNFLKKRGIPLPVSKSRSEESELELSSDDDLVYFRKVSKELRKKNVSVQASQQNFKNSVHAEQYPAGDRKALLKAEMLQVPGFLKTQQRTPVGRAEPWRANPMTNTSPAPPFSAIDTSTAIGKMSLLSNKMPKSGIKILNIPNRGVEPI